MTTATTTAPTTYAARKAARHAARWTLGEVACASRDARRQHADARGYARAAAQLAGPLPANPTERDALVWMLADRMLSDYGDKLLAAKQRRRDLIAQRRHARATLAALRWTAADQRRLDREEDEAYQRADDRAAAWFDEAAYGRDD